MLAPDFVYLSTLSVVQPARVQDIEAHVALLHGNGGQAMVVDGRIRAFHDSARRNELIVPVRRGLFVLSKLGVQIIRTEPFNRMLDNRRIFLIKSRRRRIM